MDRRIEKESGRSGRILQLMKKLFGEREKLKNAVKKAAPSVAVFSFTLLCGKTPTISGVYPFALAIVSAAGSLPTALSALAGGLLSLFFIESSALLYGASYISLFFIRLFLGALGIAETAGAPLPSAQERKPLFPEETLRKKQFLFNFTNAFSHNVKIRMICSLGAALTVGAGRIFQKGDLWYDIFSAVFIGVAVPVLTFGFHAVSNGRLRAGVRKAGVCAVGFAFFLSVSDFTVGGMNVGVVIAFLLAQTVSVSVGLSDGMLLGLFSGMALEPAFAPMYAVGAAATGILNSFSSGVASVCAAALGISWALYADGVAAFSSVMPEILLASGIFYPLSYFGLIPSQLDLFKAEKGSANSEESFIKSISLDPVCKVERISSALSGMSKIFRDLSDKLRSPSPVDCDVICENAFSAACSACGKKTICHERERFRDGRILKQMARTLKLRDRVFADSFPDSMKRGCPSVDLICDGINREYRRFNEDVIKTDKTSVIADDYEAISELIRKTVCEGDRESVLNEKLTKRLSLAYEKRGIVTQRISVYGFERPRIFASGVTVKDLSLGSEDVRRLSEECLRMPLTEPRLSIEYDRLDLSMEMRKSLSFTYGHYSSCGGCPEPNGDAVTAFELEDGKLCMLICDGMGSGSEAALTSRIGAIFLKRMLTSGCPVDTALKLLNNFTSERRIECSSTVDIFIADAYTGKAEFIKSGAAPSFVLRGNKLFRMECDTHPVGILKKLSAKSVSFNMQKGDAVIMISDGILPDEDNSAWLYDILCSPGRLSGTPAEVAEQILSTARECSDLRPDDATVGVVRVS